MATIVRPKKKNDSVEEGAPPWMVTYGDLMTQLVVFFVMLFSFSVLDVVKVTATARSIREQWQGSPAGRPPGEISDNALLNLMESVDSDVYNELVTRGTAELPIETGPKVELMKDERGIKFVLGGDIAFAEGSAELVDNEQIRAILATVVDRTRGSKNVIELRGYTSQNAEDSVPGPDGRPDHWQLGFARAKAVAMRLIDAGVDFRRIRITSGGMTEPQEKGERLDMRHKNRRVEIVVTDKLLVD